MGQKMYAEAKRGIFQSSHDFLTFSIKHFKNIINYKINFINFIKKPSIKIF